MRPNSRLVTIEIVSCDEQHHRVEADFVCARECGRRILRKRPMPAWAKRTPTAPPASPSTTLSDSSSRAMRLRLARGPYGPQAPADVPRPVPAGGSPRWPTP